MTDLERWEATLTPTPRIDLTQWATEFRDVYKIAEALCRTPFVPQAMMGKQADVAAAIMKGRELGLDPFDALDNIYVVHGRVGYYAEFQRRRIIQAGHQFKIVESTDSRCIVEGTRKDTGETHRATFTAEAARKAGIDIGKYPADKLIARATSRLCKQAFPDVLSGTLIAEDLIDGVIPPADDLEPAAPAVEGPAVQRKRATRAPRAARTQPRPAPKPTTEPDEDIAELLGDQPQPSPAGQDGGEAPPAGEPQGRSWETLFENDPPAAEQPDPAPQPETLLDLTTEPDEPATTPQNRKMHALFRELGLPERNDRLTITSHILGYNITTSRALTRNEARQLIDTAEAWQLDTDYPLADRINDILNQAVINAEAEQEGSGDDFTG